jgi:RHH-type transcriptional regulator, proline utilization regulon repressor / proline dehydrogenase / delta 1-pyrroline-5-carboxylate dehydrogenase
MSLKRAIQFLMTFKGKALTRGERTDKACTLATFLAIATWQEKTAAEKKQETWMARMVLDPKGRAFLTAMADQAFRSQSEVRTASQLVYLLQQKGIPPFLPLIDRIKFLIFTCLGNKLSHYFVPVIRKQMRKHATQVLLPSTLKEQAAYFHQCRSEKIRLNINHLGEAIFGENEALRRFKVYLEDLTNPQIDYISVKISTIFSQINMVGFAESLTILSERLRLLYNAANNHACKQLDGSETAKFVNLDMEEYKDLDLTVAVFKKVLSEPEHLHTQAGIVLQSYLPDTFTLLQDLTVWAQKRVENGGAPIKIRLVKGANWAMEAVESAIRGWELAPYDCKVDTDANFKRMLEFACQPQNAKAVHIGVGSHNLFDIAYTFILRAENQTESYVSFEMLEGMAQPLRRCVQKLAGEILLYCPEAKEKDFHSAIAYLIRRLDENCGSENFLRHFFEMHPGNEAWKKQVSHFIKACERIETVPAVRKRSQNRQAQASLHPEMEPFKNEPDTDFSLHENREWIETIFAEWGKKIHPPIPLVIGGKEIETPSLGIGIDPSRPASATYHYRLADLKLAEEALISLAHFKKPWGSRPFEERSHLLSKAAQLFRERRGDLIGVMMTDGGKTAWEADPEVSEAIDFIEYYRKNWERQLALHDIQWSAKGTILVAPPWNFPCSIPVSGIAAALTAGNCVLFKPAPEAILIGWHLACAFWDAGIPKEALQFICCADNPVGSYLVKHSQIAAVILTGSTQTALQFLRMRPQLDLHAETGGKNAMIVTALSDRDLAVRDIIASAFGHSGQKCSACSLAILEDEVYDDPDFKRQLADAATSLKVGSAWNPTSKITPLIRPPTGPLLRGLTTLEPGETWLVIPKLHPENPHLWSPGIKWGVQLNSFTHQTELFGPLLGVMRASSLEEAIRIVNSTPYGLTSGLHSLDEREHAYWKKHIVAGNLYINRGITGAIVRRQPFGGCKASSFGSGAKAGGPNYVHQFAHPSQQNLPHEKALLPASLALLISLLPTFPISAQEIDIWHHSAENYTYWANILKEPTDPSALIGQDNWFYHISLPKAYLRFEQNQPSLPLLQVIAACLICQTPLEISTALALPQLMGIEGVTLFEENETALISRAPSHIRLIAPPSSPLIEGAAQKGIILQTTPVLANGRFELLHYLREIALSFDYHRYGYLTPHSY